MKKLIDLSEEMSADIQATQEYAEHLYEKYFGKYLKDVKELYTKLQSSRRPITDIELEDVLTTLPLELIHVSEILSQFKLSKEVISLKVKQKESDYVKQSTASTITQKKEEAAIAVLEDKLMQTIYSSIITRVENEMNFARELIMSAKKIWDARRLTDSACPVAPVAPESSELPDYAYSGKASVGVGQTYIK